MRYVSGQFGNMKQVEEWLNETFCINSQVDNYELCFLMPCKINRGQGVIEEGYEALVAVWDFLKQPNEENVDEETSYNG